MCGNAQNDSIAVTAKDSIKIKEKYGLRVGGDVGKLIRSFVDDNYTGFEVSGDFRLKKHLYIGGELGTEEKNTKTKGLGNWLFILFFDKLIPYLFKYEWIIWYKIK